MISYAYVCMYVRHIYVHTLEKVDVRLVRRNFKKRARS